MTKRSLASLPILFALDHAGGAASGWVGEVGMEPALIDWNGDGKKRPTIMMHHKGEVYGFSLAKAWWRFENDKPVQRVQGSMGLELSLAYGRDD